MEDDSPLQIRSWPRAILHLDGDSFFSSVEQAIHPEYKGKPVITGKERGIVAAASYEAKAKGIGRGVPLWQVKKICPDAIILPSDYETYSLFSKRMFAIMRRFSPMVEEYSIDEAFADLTGLRRPLRAEYEEIARRIKDAVEKELGIGVSVGVSLSKVLAKIGSKANKPRGFSIVPGYKIHEFLKGLPLEKIWGIGEQTAAHLTKQGVKDALDFARRPEYFVKRHLTKPGVEIWKELNGESVYPVTDQEKTSYASIMKGKTFTPPSADESFVFAQLIRNLESATIKVRRYNLASDRIVIYLKTQTFKSYGLEASLNRPSGYPNDFIPVVKEMFGQLFQKGVPYRSTGVVLVRLRENESLQGSLFEPPLRIEKLEHLYEAMDMINERYGKHTLHLGASHQVKKQTQHEGDRGDIPWRMTELLDGENRRQRVGMPRLDIKA